MDQLAEKIQTLTVEDRSTNQLVELVEKLTVEDNSLDQLTVTTRELTVEDGLRFLDKVRDQCNSEAYKQFLDIMRAFKAATLRNGDSGVMHRINVAGVIICAEWLFRDHRDLFKEFHIFVPHDAIEVYPEYLGTVVNLNDYTNLEPSKMTSKELARALYFLDKIKPHCDLEKPDDFSIMRALNGKKLFTPGEFAMASLFSDYPDIVKELQIFSVEEYCVGFFSGFWGTGIIINMPSGRMIVDVLNSTRGNKVSTSRG